MTTTQTYRCIVPGCERETDGGLQCGPCRERAAIVAEIEAERTASDDPAERDVLEATRQAEGIHAMQAKGWTVFRVGQYNARGTQDPGPADTICFHEARRLFAFVEWKRPVGGEQSQAQRGFQRLCEAVGVRYVLASQVAHVEDL